MHHLKVIIYLLKVIMHPHPQKSNPSGAYVRILPKISSVTFPIFFKLRFQKICTLHTAYKLLVAYLTKCYVVVFDIVKFQVFQKLLSDRGCIIKKWKPLSRTLDYQQNVK